MERRDMLKGLAVVTAAAAASKPEMSTANWGQPHSPSDGPKDLLVNRARADQVMSELGLDGLIAYQPINVFYLTNRVPYLTKMANPVSAFAVYPKDQSKPASLIVSNVDLWTLANGDKEYPARIIPYTFATNWRDYEDPANWPTAPTASGSGYWPVDEENFTAKEAAWIAMERKYADDLVARPEYGLAKALREAGLEKGRLACDDPRIEQALDMAGMKDVTCVPGENVFRKIRVIKSEPELYWMRETARINQEAATAAMLSLGKGATQRDIDIAFMVEAAKRGAMSTWLAAGTTGGLPDGELVEGKPILIDAVSQVNYYHGDFGRTYVLGEPPKSVLERTRVMQIGWQAAFEAMKPGMTYGEVNRIATDAMNKAGKPEAARIGAGPHSVGLQHTDEPFRDNVPFPVKDDLVLEEGMTLTVDFPSLNPGWGAAHLEDLVVITKDGCEALGTMDGPLLVG